MSNKTIIKHPIHTFQTYIARERASYTPRKELGHSATKESRNQGIYYAQIHGTLEQEIHLKITVS